MLQLVLGMPRSGKSLWAESLMLKRVGSLTYVGTLPRAPMFFATIDEHRTRRPSSWSLLELEGNFIRDMAELHKKIRGNENLLLDGLSFYLIRCYALQGDSLFAALGKASILIEEAASSRSQVMIVDSPIAPRLKRPERHLLLLAQHAIMQRARDLWVYRCPEAIRLTPRQAIKWSRTVANTERFTSRKPNQG